MRMGEGSGGGPEKEEVLMKGNKVGSYCDMEREQTFGITLCVCCVKADCDCSWKTEINIGMCFSHLHIYEDRVSLSCKLEVL